VLSSKPKKPSLAVVPLCQRNSIPRSLLSLVAGAVSPPSVKIGSSILTVVLLTVVVVPFTIKLPPIVKLPVTLPNPPIYKFSLIPTPPVTTSVPVVVLVLVKTLAVPPLQL